MRQEDQIADQMFKRRYLCIEGCECAGKTTLFNELRDRMRGPNWVFLPEKPLALSVDYDIGVSAGCEFEVALLSESAIAMAQIRATIGEDTFIISDRGWISNIAYASARKRINPKFDFDPDIHRKQSLVFAKTFPEVLSRMILFSIEIPPSVSMERWQQRCSTQLERGHNVDPTWLQVANEEYGAALQFVCGTLPTIEVVRVDGQKTKEEIMARALSLIGQ